MYSTSVLSTPDFSIPFVIACDAFKFRLRVVLMQDTHPITFEGIKLNKRERLKSTYDKKKFAIMHTVTKLNQYILGMDNNNLQYILQHKNILEKKKTVGENTNTP